jgi:protein-tyrosine-phosphatase
MGLSSWPSDSRANACAPRRKTEGRLAKSALEVVFVSLTGSGRAEIGAALRARVAGKAVRVHSAGSDAVGETDENVQAAPREIGIDLPEAFTKPLTYEVLASADIVVTVGRSVGLRECRRVCDTSTGASATPQARTSTRFAACATISNDACSPSPRRSCRHGRLPFRTRSHPRANGYSD